MHVAGPAPGASRTAGSERRDSIFEQVDGIEHDPDHVSGFAGADSSGIVHIPLSG